MTDAALEIDWESVFSKPLDAQFKQRLSALFDGGVCGADAGGISLAEGDHIAVVGGIPRLIPSDDYAGSFSYQWLNYTTTQLDSAQGMSLTEQDLINKTGLTPQEVRGKLILDAGVGVGRHAEILASWGGYVVGVDLSAAVETAQENLKHCPNAVVMQANIGDLPFAREVFDHVVSIGVLHHTPDTRQYTERLMPLVKKGGRLSVWVYSTVFDRRADWVPLVSRLPLRAFQEWCEWIVDVARDRPGNRWLEAFRAQFPFSSAHPTRERSVLALFDGYTPTFHWTHTPEEVVAWFTEAGFIDVRTCAIPTSVSGRKPTQ